MTYLYLFSDQPANPFLFWKESQCDLMIKMLDCHQQIQVYFHSQLWKITEGLGASHSLSVPPTSQDCCSEKMKAGSILYTALSSWLKGKVQI